MSDIEIEVNDTRNFTVGMPIVCEMRGGRLVRAGRLRVLVRRAWRRMTWWRWPVSQVASIDGPAGSITLVAMRWSWRRWRWEPVPLAEDFAFRDSGALLEGMEPWQDVGQPEGEPLVPHREWCKRGTTKRA